MRNVSSGSCGKHKNTRLCSVTFFRQTWHLWNNVENYGTVGRATDDNITWYIRFACWITKATNTHSESVILIAWQRQQRFCERLSMLRSTYFALVCVSLITAWGLLLLTVSNVIIFCPSRTDEKWLRHWKRRWLYGFCNRLKILKSLPEQNV
jgi:hypothetical protein